MFAFVKLFFGEIPIAFVVFAVELITVIRVLTMVGNPYKPYSLLWGWFVAFKA